MFKNVDYRAFLRFQFEADKFAYQEEAAKVNCFNPH